MFRLVASFDIHGNHVFVIMMFPVIMRKNFGHSEAGMNVGARNRLKGFWSLLIIFQKEAAVSLTEIKGCKVH